MMPPSGDQLIGRDVELARIARLLEATPGDAAALVITGGRGSGRSSLLAVGRQRARRAGRHRVLTLSGAGPERRPYPHLLLAVRHDLATLPAAVGGPALAVLGLAPAGHRPDDGELPSVVEAAVTAIAARSPVLIVADDAHDLEPRVLATIARLSAVPSVAVLAAGRSPLPAQLAGMPVMDLAPLGPDDARCLLVGRGPTSSAAARAAILHRAHGNPAALVELGDPARSAGGLLAAFTADIGRLPAPTRLLVLHLAAAGIPTDPELIRAAVGTTEDDDWLPAMRSGLLVRTGADLDFAHPVAAEAAYRSALIDQRLQAHRALSVALTAVPEQQALHRAAAEPGADEEIAAALETAGATFRERGQLYEAAAALHTSARRSPDPQDAARRLTEAVAAARDLRDTAWATELYAQVRKLTGNPDLLTRAAWPAAAVTLWSGRPHEAYGILGSVPGHGGRNPRNTLNLAVLAATIAWLTGDEDHRLGLTALLNAAGPAPDPIAATYVRQILAPHEHPGRALDRPLGVPAEGAPLSPQDRYRLALFGMVAWTEDRSRVAAGALRRALAGDLFENSPSPGFGLQLALVNALLDTGEWELAQRYATAPRAGGLVTMDVGLAALRALLHALRGESGQALRLAQETWPRLDVHGNRPAYVRLLRACGLASITAGDHDSGYRYLRSMFHLDGRPLHPYLSARAVADLVVAAVRNGRRGDARTVLDQVRRAAGAEPGARMRILLALSEAVLSDDEDSFRQAVDDPAGEQWPYERGLANLHHGVWLRRHRGTREARVALAAAEEIFNRLGASAGTDLARQEITVGTPGRPGTPLTAQEQRVAELAAAGLSNRLIAERLFLSSRTVSTHLSRVYRKVGVHGRQQLGTGLVRAMS